MKSLLRLMSVLRALLATLVVFSASHALAAGPLPAVEVYKSPYCGCCGFWVEHMKQNGFEVNIHNMSDVTPMREKLGVPSALASCHTAVVGGYAIEGHVPAADVKRLLLERPKAVGLAVPGMVQGSPGMEQGSSKDPYKVVLIGSNGKSSVFAEH